MQHSFASPSHNNQKKEKGNPNCKIKLSLFADDMILYLENPKDATRKLLKLANEFGKINARKSVAFLYTSNETSEREIKETISFTITSKGIKYLEINWPKETKDL